MVPNTNNRLLIQNRKEQRKQKRESRKKSKPQEERNQACLVRGAHLVGKKRAIQQSEQEPKPLKKSKVKLQSSSSCSKISRNSDPYSHLDTSTAMAMRRDDEEIAELEAKLGLSARKEKKRLHMEYAKEEGYGDDFGDFLDDLDHLEERLNGNTVTSAQHDHNDDSSSSSSRALPSENEKHDNGDDSSDSENENLKKYDGSVSDSDENEEDDFVPLAPPADDIDEERFDDEKARHKKEEEGSDSHESDSDSKSKQSKADKDNEDEPDHDVRDTYRPSAGEDIYGNTIDPTKRSTKTSKYVPPHLRAQKNNNPDGEVEDDVNKQELLCTIRRALNNSFNRLSEDTLMTVSQSVAGLYLSHPTALVNECIWKNMHSACIARTYLMTGLTPLYAAAIVGIHIQKGDSAQLGEYMIEIAVTDLYRQLPRERKQITEDATKDLEQDENDMDAALTGGVRAKQITNLLLFLCYLYNFDVVHCGLMYDLVRDFICSFTEIDIELLLIILNHCGRSLRSDDPSALKTIVLDVQNRVVQEQSHERVSASRVDYMVSAVMDLKNNKRRQQDWAGEKVAKLRKLIGRIKSTAANQGVIHSSDVSHRIGLKDILDVKTKGRWWRVGASWEGNQYMFCGGGSQDDEANVLESGTETKAQLSGKVEEDAKKENKLLKLAAKYRMNTDVRRTIFCIIMGSADYEDAFEKLAKAGMLKHKAEREAARVLMECCGNEKSFNNFYAHLAKRICEFQGQAKFTFQLAYWDVFKQFSNDSNSNNANANNQMKPRKAANLAKLLYSLVVEHKVLKLNVLKGIDMTSPDDLSEIGMIFLTVFFTSIFEHYDNPSEVSRLFESGLRWRQHQQKAATTTQESWVAQGLSSGGSGTGSMVVEEEMEALYASLMLFFVQVLKSSPKYALNGSKFRENLKVAIKACDVEIFFL